MDDGSVAPGDRLSKQRWIHLRSRWWWAAVVGAVVVVAVLAGTIALRVQSNSCQNVDELIAFNKSQMEVLQSRTHVPAAGSHDEPSAPGEADYQAWADGLEKHADEVSDPELAKHARRAAELADQAVVVIRDFRTESSNRDILDLEPPPSVKKYGEVTARLNSEMQALENACPQG